MTPDSVVQIIREMLLAAFWLSAPLLAIGFVAGIVVSLIQIVTSIQDSGFNAIPRLIAFLGGFILLMPWMLKKMMAYTIAILGDLGRYAR
ncbi:MAG: flagellar biosynthetic protein FliQ [Acidobacteriota bacterium]|nr:flagellar biosynthetic protein FliQ [Acidobacteriota bacterium]